MKYNILSVYGDVKLNQNICKKCGRRFFVLDDKDFNNYCDDCKLYITDNNLTPIKKTRLIFHTPLYKRKYIPKKIRLKVYERDNYICVYCERDLYKDFLINSGKITVDHFVPYIGRGEAEIGNLFTACKRCNSSKYSTLFNSIEEVREYLKSRGKIENAKENTNQSFKRR